MPDKGVRINACQPGCFDVCYRGLVLWAFLRAQLSLNENRAGGRGRFLGG